LQPVREGLYFLSSPPRKSAGFDVIPDSCRFLIQLQPGLINVSTLGDSGCRLWRVEVPVLSHWSPPNLLLLWLAAGDTKTFVPIGQNEVPCATSVDANRHVRSRNEPGFCDGPGSRIGIQSP
jgi:hypothetical protein